MMLLGLNVWPLLVQLPDSVREREGVSTVVLLGTDAVPVGVSVQPGDTRNEQVCVSLGLMLLEGEVVEEGERVWWESVGERVVSVRERGVRVTDNVGWVGVRESVSVHVPEWLLVLEKESVTEE